STRKTTKKKSKASRTQPRMPEATAYCHFGERREMGVVSAEVASKSPCACHSLRIQITFCRSTARARIHAMRKESGDSRDITTLDTSLQWLEDNFQRELDLPSCGGCPGQQTGYTRRGSCPIKNV